MIDKKQNKELRNLDFDCVQFSQFKEFNCENEITAIQARLYFLMINGLMPRGENESLYGWCGRLGLSNSTIFGIFKKDSKIMHLSVARKISAATGANVEWIQHGRGEPLKELTTDSIIARQIEEALEINKYQPDLPNEAEFSLELNILAEATHKISTLDLHQTIQMDLRDIVYAIDTQNTELLHLTIKRLLNDYGTFYK